jgi:membrane protein insertase Oxa1/YidC/SpoIIIJ
MNLFIVLIYQPFLNLLVLFYWALGSIPGLHPDMGIAVILLSIAIRIVLFPLTLASDRSEHERHEIAIKAKEIEIKYATDPVMLNKEIKKLFKTKPRIIMAEFVDLGISILVTVLLIRIFATGIEGADLHLLYPWIPKVAQPYNLVFLGKFDLSQPNFFLNLLQSLVILLVEIVAEFTSPFHNLLSKEHVIAPPTNAITNTKDNYVVETRSRVRSLQVFLPIVSFLIFMFLPAGKKLFIITTLLFSLMTMLVKAARRKFVQMFPEPEPVPVEVITPLETTHTTPSAH